MPQKRMECFRLLFDHLAWIEHQFLSGIRDSRKAGSLWGKMRGVGGVRKSEHQNWLAKGLGLLCWGFKGVQEDIPSEEASTLEIGSVVFPPGQCTSPQLHPCHRLFDQEWTSRQFLTLPIVETSLPVTFGYSLSSEAVVMRQLRWKRLWRRSLTRSHKRTSMGPSRSCWNGTQVHCSRRRLLRRGLEFHVCTINKSAHTKKSGNLSNDPRIYIYIYSVTQKEIPPNQCPGYDTKQSDGEVPVKLWGMQNTPSLPLLPGPL